MTRATLPPDAASDGLWDAIVLGAGPAGSTAARLLARKSARVLLVDKKTFPREKVCGACLNGRALSVLNAVGLGTLPARLGGAMVDAFELRIRNVATRLRLPEGIAVSRNRFDDALIDAAVSEGTAFLPGTSASVEPASADCRRVRLASGDHTKEAQARVVLVATGLGAGCLAHEPAIQHGVAKRSRIGAGCTVHEAPAAYGEGTIFMALAHTGYVGLVRVEEGRLNVAAALDPGAVKSLGAAHAAAAVLADAGFPEVPSLTQAAWRGTTPLTWRTWPVAAERLFVLGDAAGYVEPFTGEGMAWALAAGEAVAPLALRASERWESALEGEWIRAYRREIGARQQLCKGMALVLRYPGLMSAGMSVVDRLPALARPILRRLNAGALTVEATAP